MNGTILDDAISIIYAVFDSKGFIVFDNNAFSHTYSHIRPNSYFAIGNGAREAAIKAKHEGKAIPTFVTCKDTEGGTMVIAYEVFFKDNHFHFLGVVEADIESVDEGMFANLKELKKRATFHLSHNVRAPLTKVIGLADIMCLSNDAQDQLRIAEMIGNAARELDNAIIALGDILNR